MKITKGRPISTIVMEVFLLPVKVTAMGAKQVNSKPQEHDHKNACGRGRTGCPEPVHPCLGGHHGRASVVCGTLTSNDDAGSGSYHEKTQEKETNLLCLEKDGEFKSRIFDSHSECLRSVLVQDTGNRSVSFWLQ